MGQFKEANILLFWNKATYLHTCNERNKFDISFDVKYPFKLYICIIFQSYQ